MSSATKAPKPKIALTLRDSMDLYALIDQYVETHVDEIELNGGALPDDLAALLDEVDGAREDRVDALAAKIDQFAGYATSAKATKDRAARREKVWNNAIKGMKSYALFQVQRNGGAPLKGSAASFRLQNNGAPSVECALTPEELLDASDCSIVGPAISDHPLGRFISVTAVATIDLRQLGAAYEARRTDLITESALFSESDIPWTGGERPVDVTAEQIDAVITDMRTRYIADHLAAEFPGVTCVRGVHLRID